MYTLNCINFERIFQIALEHLICRTNLLYSNINKNECSYRRANVLLWDFGVHNSNTRRKFIPTINIYHIIIKVNTYNGIDFN